MFPNDSRQAAKLLTTTHHLTILIKQLKLFQMPAEPVHGQTGSATLSLFQFCLLQDTNLDSHHKAGPLMISAESTDLVYSFYLP